jgi:hypothetical protein
MKSVTVEYQIATYSGEIDLMVDENAENEHIIAQAKNILRKQSGGSLPFGSQSFNITVND